MKITLTKEQTEILLQSGNIVISPSIIIAIDNETQEFFNSEATYKPQQFHEPIAHGSLLFYQLLSDGFTYDPIRNRLTNCNDHYIVIGGD